MRHPAAAAKRPVPRVPKAASPVGAHDEVASAAGLAGKERKGSSAAFPARVRPPADAASNIGAVAFAPPPFLRFARAPATTGSRPPEGAATAPLLQTGLIRQGRA